ncbi:hypothetical protein Pmani_010295 [Petrolisthes manimaculis]|uniref:CHK kinase-like domain-containing protein n=1 Tax=Petrolisthes manimaculis TaxID=1843537 RepID=A0AAE1UC47_9EUCA|nr:hypothetical protein Pmani_010295 [Petrolisthes manimaculis]
MEEERVLVPLHSLEDLSHDWLQQVLRNALHTNVKFKSWKTNTKEDITGFASDISFITVSYITHTHREIEETRSLVVKFMPQNTETANFLRDGNLALREVEFYKYAASEEFKLFCHKSGMQNLIPELYWAGIDGDRLTVVLEDLCCRKYKTLIPSEGISLSQVKIILSAIATVHAAGFHSINRYGSHQLDMPWNTAFLQKSVEVGLGRLTGIYSNTPLAGTFKVFFLHLENLLHSDHCHSFLRTLIHGDLWTGNVMFSTDEKSVSIFDWQFAHFGNPVCDIIILLILSSSPSVYEDHLIEVLECYWESFKESLMKNGGAAAELTYTLQDLMRNVEDLWFFGFMFLCAAFPDLLDFNKMSETRLKSIITFLDKRGVFTRPLVSVGPYCITKTEPQELPPLKSDKEISRRWLEAMLGRKTETPVLVESWSVRLPEGREGFLSEIAFVEVEFVKQEVSQKDYSGKDEESTQEMENNEPYGNVRDCGSGDDGGGEEENIREVGCEEKLCDEEERNSLELECEEPSGSGGKMKEEKKKMYHEEEDMVGKFEIVKYKSNRQGKIKRQKITEEDGTRKEKCRLVFKFLPHDPNLKKFLDNGDLAEREVEFYKFVSSNEFRDIGVDVPVPEVYYASYTKDAITLILRDLNQDDYGSVIIRDGSSLDQTKTALRAVAAVHAAGYLYLQCHGIQSSLATLAREFKTEFYEEFFQPNLNTLVEMYKGTSLAEIFKALLPLTPEIRATSCQNPFFETIIHGDLWAGQLLYAHDQQSASVIDWQFCHLDNPVSDIMSMFFMSTDPRVLEDHLPEILEDYWRTLCRILKAGGGNTTKIGDVWKMGVKDQEKGRNMKNNRVKPEEFGLEQLAANVEKMWIYGFMFLTVSLHDFLNGDSISRDRLDGAMTFLEKRGVFRRFLEKFDGRKTKDSI